MMEINQYVDPGLQFGPRVRSKVGGKAFNFSV